MQSILKLALKNIDTVSQPVKVCKNCMALQVSPPSFTLLSSYIIKTRLNDTKPSIHFELNNSTLPDGMLRAT